MTLKQKQYTFTLHDVKLIKEVKDEICIESELTSQQLWNIVSKMIYKYNLPKYTEDDVFKVKLNVMYLIDHTYVISSREERAIVESEVQLLIHEMIGDNYIKSKACICVIT